MILGASVFGIGISICIRNFISIRGRLVRGAGLLGVVLYFSSFALAAGHSASSSSSQHAVGADFRVYGGVGTGGNQDGSNPKRTIAAGGVMLDLLARVGILRPHVRGDFRGIGQIAQPSTAYDESLTGYAYFVSAGLGFEFSSVAFDFDYVPMGTYKPSQKTITGETSTYTEPQGYTAIFEYKGAHAFKPFLFFNMTDFKSVTYSVSGTTDLSTNKLNMTTFGAGLTYEFF